jgi:hypothetical protein
MSKDIFINGPTNVVRLEGKINGINKVMYDFFDIHVSENFQTKCEDIRSNDIARFLVKTFDELKTKSDKTYDFMVERHPLTPAFRPSKVKGRYLDQVQYLFNRAFKIDLNKGIVQKSDELPNVRLHWVDIRDYVLNFTIDLIYKNIPQVINNLKNNLNIFNINQLCDLIKMTTAQIIFIYKILYETKDLQNPKFTKQMFSVEEDILSKYTLKEYDELIKKMIYKLLKGYSNNEVQEKILYIINNDLHNIFLDFFKFIGDSLGKLEKLRERLAVVGNNNMYEVLIKREDGTYGYGISSHEYDNYITWFNDIHENIFNYLIGGIGMYFMDLFLLRRSLDKNYITNTITYTGALHSMNYIRILVKYFDFNITNCAYINDNDIKNSVNIIKKSKKVEDLKEIFFQPIRLQCTNLKNFPPLFE